MTVYFRDNVGIVAATLTDDETGLSVDFCDGFAYFMVGETDYKIPVMDIIRIER